MLLPPALQSETFTSALSLESGCTHAHTLSLSLLSFAGRLRRDGEDLEAQDPSDGCRPLHAAVLTEQTEAASYLIRHGVIVAGRVGPWGDV